VRSFAEIKTDLSTAFGTTDVGRLRDLSIEFRTLGTPEALVMAGHAEGNAWLFTGNYGEALKSFERVTEILETMNDRSLVAFNAMDLGTVFWRTGNYAHALEQLNRALDLFLELEIRDCVASTLSNIGTVCLEIGEYPQALERLERSLHISQEIGDKQLIANVTGSIGIVYYNTGDYAKALELFLRAGSMLDDVADRVSAATNTFNVGNAYSELGDYVQALAHYEGALAIHKELGGSYIEAYVLGGMADVHVKMNDLDEAKRLLAMMADMTLDAPNAQSMYYHIRSRLFEALGDDDALLTELTKALETADSAGLRSDSANYHLRLRDLAQRRNDFEAYIKHNTEHLRINEEIRGKEATQKLTMMEAQRNIDAERKERDKERAVLYSTLPKHVADRVVCGESVDGDTYDNTAVLFLDIVAFTDISDKLSPTEVISLLGNIFVEVDRICSSNRTTKIKTIGDSYLAVAGLE